MTRPEVETMTLEEKVAFDLINVKNETFHPRVDLVSAAVGGIGPRS